MVTARDSSGNGAHGVYDVLGMTLTHPAGAVGTNKSTQMFTDPISTQITQVIIDPNPLDPSGDFTIEFWLKDPVDPDRHDGFQVFAVHPASGNTIGVYIDSSNAIRVEYGGAFSDEALTNNNAYPNDEQFHHIVATVSTGSRAIYLDGSTLTLASSAARVALSASGWDALTFAPTTAYPTVNFAPTLDEVAVYESALSAGRVAAHYAAAGDFDDYVAEVLADSPVGYWHLDDREGGWSVGKIGVG